MKVTCGVLAGVMLVLALPAYAQSLAELAKKEAERRKTLPTAAKVYTDDDLKKVTVPGGTGDDTKPPADSTDAKPQAAKVKDGDDAKDAKGSDAKDDKTAPVMDEAAWRAKITAAREDLSKSEMFRDALQSQINGLTAQFTARDDPYQRAQIGDQRQKAIAELESVKKDIESAKKAISGIEEDARRANVPPGWIR